MKIDSKIEVGKLARERSVWTLVALVPLGMGILVGRLLVVLHVPGLVVNSLSLGIVLGVVFCYEYSRRKQKRERARIIKLMNHHVRNALQVLVFDVQHQDPIQMTIAVQRIDWALKEILPGDGHDILFVKPNRA